MIRKYNGSKVYENNYIIRKNLEQRINRYIKKRRLDNNKMTE